MDTDVDVNSNMDLDPQRELVYSLNLYLDLELGLGLGLGSSVMSTWESRYSSSTALENDGNRDGSEPGDARVSSDVDTNANSDSDSGSMIQTRENIVEPPMAL